MKKSSFYNAHHAPIGAFASFTLGFPGKSGGLGLELRGPADQDVYIGVEAETKGHYQALPFFAGHNDQRANYDVENHTETRDAKVAIQPCAAEDIQRSMGVSTDSWKIKDLTFTIYSPVHGVPDPRDGETEELKMAVAPAVLCELTVDNSRTSTRRKAFFGYAGNDPYSNMRVVKTNDRGLIGVGQGMSTGIFTDSPDARADLGFSMEEVVTARDKRNTFGLGDVGGLVFEVAPNEIKTVRFAVCFYRGGRATAGINARYYYTRFFDGIEEVARYALEKNDEYKSWARQADEMITSAQKLSDEQKFMISHAIRSYYGSTELLCGDGEPLWVVNEGEYRMMNTFDLMVDQLFFELKMNPWTIRNQLDMYVDRYSYCDKVRFPGETAEYPGGISFTHDMGVGNVFSPPGRSVYELAGLDGCFSYMTYEQLVNWILCASVYFEKSGDGRWVDRNAEIFRKCLTSMTNRDNPDPAHRNGIMSLDSSRTAGGSEITTYDSLDASLGQARNNIYPAVKSWAAYLALKRVFERIGDDSCASDAEKQATLCAATIESSVTEEGYIPAIIGEENSAKIIPVIEGLVFPYAGNNGDMVSEDGPFGSFIKTLKKHLRTVLVRGECLFDDGGWKLSSTSDNSWLSKIYLSQFVARKILNLETVQNDTRADAVHVSWLLDRENAYFAWSDQMIAGKARGSKYYPRGVTSILWLEE